MDVRCVELIEELWGKPELALGHSKLNTCFSAPPPPPSPILRASSKKYILPYKEICPKQMSL